MCDPIVGTALAAYGQYAQGQAQASQANAAATQAKQNEALAIQQANDVQQQKAQEQKMLQRQSNELRGKQVAAMAGAGVDSSTGSGLNILTDTAYNTQEDINQLEWNAAKKQWGYQQQAENYKAEAGAYKAAASNARTMGLIGAATTLASYGQGADSSWKGSGSAAKANTTLVTPGKVFPSTDWLKKPNYSFTNPLVSKPKSFFPLS